ncbi:MAG: hypothetical protein HW399_855 [Dehalococcoidia bacterium]|nr:hypothetical protein [Dehalococcoidia bacterium]
MSKQDKHNKQLAKEVLGLRNTILVTKRKSKMIQSSKNLLITDNRRSFVSDFESSDWVIELTYKQGFSFVDYMDYRRERISNLLHALLTLVTINWEKVWIIFTYKSPRSEELVTAYPLSSVWVLDDEHIIFRNEEEEMSLKQFQLYPLYRRRLGSIQNEKENSPLWIALNFYWHHLTLKSEYMRIIALCISLESLFNTGPNEIRKTIGLCDLTPELVSLPR